jgi:C-terminal processing protease CtpA/Prc
MGEPGSTMQIVVQTPGDEPRELTIERQRVNSSMPVPSASFITPNGQNIGYLILPSVYDLNIPETFIEAYQSLAENGTLDGLIIDNRINGGGSDYIAKQVMRLFTDGVLGYYVNRDDKEAFSVRGKDINNSQTIPLVMLVGEDSVSFGEIMPAILQDLGRATIIGETTLGNVEVLYGYDFQDDSQLWLAHDTFQTAVTFDRNWEDTGVIPDIEAPADWDKVNLFTDPAILASLEYFDCAKTETAACY